MTTPEELDRMLERSLDRMMAFHLAGPKPLAADAAAILMSRLIERYPQSLTMLGRRLAGPLHVYHGLCYKCGLVPPNGPQSEVCSLCLAEEDQAMKDHGIEPEGL